MRCWPCSGSTWRNGSRGTGGLIMENQCALDAKPEESGSRTGQPSPTPELADSLTLLIAALHEQTAAINRLAISNEALVQAMAEAEGCLLYTSDAAEKRIV